MPIEWATIFPLLASFSFFTGLGGVNLDEIGVPTVEELLGHYCLTMGIDEVENFNFYMAFSFFKLAAIGQGIHKRFLQGKLLYFAKLRR